MCPRLRREESGDYKNLQFIGITFLSISICIINWSSGYCSAIRARRSFKNISVTEFNGFSKFKLIRRGRSLSVFLNQLFVCLHLVFSQSNISAFNFIKMEAQVEHMLALKVMRVTRPTLCNFGNTIFAEKQDLLAFDVKNEVIPNHQFLQLPQSFGNIYLGETFSSYICVHNCTTHPVNAVSVKCDLQSNSSRVSIPIHQNRTIPTALNQPGETLDDVIHYEVKEIGTHILVCEVSYVSPSGMPLSFRKFFKFQVLKPLDLTTKFYTSENDVILLEATVS